MRKLIPLILQVTTFVLAGGAVFAQDPHYTQAHRIPSWYNPAAAGHGVEHIRLTLLYRNQWSSVTSPFKTEGLFFDKQVSKVGFGANLVNNSAGDAGIRQLFLNGQLSYRLSLGKHRLASGVQIGFIQKSFDPSKMTFDDQYTPDQGFNPGNPTSETFSYTKLTRPDFGAGLLWTYGTAGKDKFLPYAGLSLQHINQPKESFIEANNIIPRKITSQAGIGIRMKESVTVTPMLMYASQQSAKELMGAVMVKWPLDGRDNVEGGIIFRNKDAVALYAGYQWNSFMMGVSYDANISGLTGGPGAFELTLTYIPKAKVKKDPEKKKDKEKKEAPAAKKKAPVSNVPVTSSKLKASAPAIATPTKEKPVSVKSVPPAKKEEMPSKAIPVKPVTATKPTAPVPAVKETVPAEMTRASYQPLPVRVHYKSEKPQPVRSTIIRKNTLPVFVPEPEDVPASVPPAAPVLQAVVKPLPAKVKTDNKIPAPQKGSIRSVNRLPLNTPETLPVAEEVKPNIVVPAPVVAPKAAADADGDGVPDHADECPYIKGSPLQHGCPDTDGDGIIDKMDQCPLEAGTKESNGCAVKGALTSSGALVAQHFGNIEFKTSSAEVHGLYKLDIIEPAIDSLFAHDNLMLVITGHTDSEGDAPFNMILSQERADAVKAIFIKKGLPEEKITTVTYGETMPLKDNETESGRQRNRRVEIHVIQKKNP